MGAHAPRRGPKRPLHGHEAASTSTRSPTWTGWGMWRMDSVTPSRGDGSGPGWAFMPYVPHTVGPVGRSCDSCHLNRVAVGLGIQQVLTDDTMLTVPIPAAVVIHAAPQRSRTSEASQPQRALAEEQASGAHGEVIRSPLDLWRPGGFGWGLAFTRRNCGGFRSHNPNWLRIFFIWTCKRQFGLLYICIILKQEGAMYTTNLRKVGGSIMLSRAACDPGAIEATGRNQSQCGGRWWTPGGGAKPTAALQPG